MLQACKKLHAFLAVSYCSANLCKKMATLFRLEQKPLFLFSPQRFSVTIQHFILDFKIIDKCIILKLSFNLPLLLGPLFTRKAFIHMFSSVINFHMPTISKSKTSIFYPNSLFSLRELTTFQKKLDLKETFITFQLRFLFRDNFSPSFKLLGQFCKNMSPIIDTSFLGCLLMMLH